MAENHPHLLDQTPVGAADIDGGREEKKQQDELLEVPTLHFPLTIGKSIT